MNSIAKRKVLIIYKYLPQWRIDFFNRLRLDLRKHSVELSLCYGKLRNDDSTKGDEVDLDWARFVDNKVVRLGAVDLYWQPCLKEIFRHDLVIVEQANKLLVNYFLVVLRRLTKMRFAFWGHGLSLRDDPKSTGNRVKKLYSTQCDWWFAYTERVKERVISFGYPAERITVVNNAIDTASLAQAYNEVSEDALDNLRSSLKIGPGPVGIFCGGMYGDKRLDFLIAACHKIRDQIPTFEMIFIGSGPEKHKIENASARYQWVHYVGTKFGKNRIPYFKLADLSLLPGAVGLAVLDSFALQTPLVTTTYRYQGPEIDYLENNVNGVVVENSVDEFSCKVVELLSDSAFMEELKTGCRRDAIVYNVDRMVENFADGILRALYRKHGGT